MSILQKFKLQKLKIAWRFSTKKTAEIIWKLLISPDGILAGEERDTEEKTASLFALEVESGKVLWRYAKIDEAWWFNSERATAENIFIQKFRKPDMPEPKGIVVLDIHTGKLRWEQPDLAIAGFRGSGFGVRDSATVIFGQREAYGRKEFFILNSITGEVLEAIEQAEVSAMLSTEDYAPDIDSVYSMAITPHDELFNAISEVLADILHVENLRGTIDFAEYGKYIIFSYHEKSEVRSSKSEVILPLAGDFGLRTPDFGFLKNHLKVLDKERGEIVYSDEPNAETPYPVPENFFIHRGVLIYVKEKREIIGVSLVDSR